MITLDDVINDFEICHKASLNLASCSGCSYANDHDVNCRSHLIADVLYCLKECRAEQQENDPLTWEELMTMEGKPVWIDINGYGDWNIIINVNSESITTAPWSWLFKDDVDIGVYGKDWNAYRKELEDAAAE